MTTGRGSTQAPGPAQGRGGAIARMLGERCAAGGPFALLELSPSRVRDEDVIASLDRQLTRLASHPQCDTPEADEVRLALHAAAAQLLDEKVRAHLVAHWTGEPAHDEQPSAPSRPGQQQRGSPPVGQTPSRSPTLTKQQIALEHDAIRTLGMLGGWNSKSLRHLLSLAHARGMNSADVAQTLSRLGRRRAVVPPRVTETSTPTGNGVHPKAPRLEQPTLASDPDNSDFDNPADEAIRMGLIAIGVTVLAILVAVPLILFFALQGSRSEPEVTPTPAPPPALAESREPARETPAPTPDASEPDVTDAGLALELGGGAVEEFASSVRRLASDWVEAPADERLASMHEIIEFFYQSSRSPDVLGACIAEVGRGARRLEGNEPISKGQVLETIWSVGALTRLSRERDLPVLARNDITRRLTAALGERRVVFDQSFKAGALVAIGMLPGRLLDPPEGEKGAGAWLRWIEAVEAVTEEQESARTVLLLGGLETLLIEGGEPNEDQRVFGALRAFVKHIPWRLGDESRRRVVSWFDDSRFSSADLHALTSTLANESSAGGVDVTMVLPLLASERVRTEMQERYAAAWGLTNPIDRAELAQELIRAASTEIRVQVAPEAAQVEHLVRAVVLSRLTEAVSWAWRGRTQEADELLAALQDGIDMPSRSSGGKAGELSSGPTSVGGNSWEERYLSARNNVAIRLDLLEQLGAQMPSAVIAEIVVEEALRGTPHRVREEARASVLANTSHAGVVNAVLEQLPFAPKTIDNNRLIEAVSGRVLPAPSTDGWERIARRALVERLLEMISSSGDYRHTDELVLELGTTYAGRIADRPLVGSARLAGDPPEVSAPLLWRRWRERVDRATPNSGAPLQLETIERRRTARLNQASGPIQFFAAQQVSVCELMSYVVAGEQPDRAADIAIVLEDLSAQRQSAQHVLEQIHAVERAMLRLWLIRIGEEAAWTTG